MCSKCAPFGQSGLVAHWLAHVPWGRAKVCGQSNGSSTFEGQGHGSVTVEQPALFVQHIAITLVGRDSIGICRPSSYRSTKSIPFIATHSPTEAWVVLITIFISNVMICVALLWILLWLAVKKWGLTVKWLFVKQVLTKEIWHCSQSPCCGWCYWISTVHSC